MSIPVFRPSVRRREMDAVLSCLVSDQIGPGGVSDRLTGEIGTYLHADSGCAFREYPRAIRTAFELLDLAPGAGVVVPVLAPAVYLDVMREMGLEPLIADVDPESGLLTAEQVERFLPRNPAAVVVHETLGFIPELEELSELGLPLVEDVSQSFGGNTGERKCGSFGRYTVCSLEPEGILTTGGGAVLLAGSRKDSSNLKKRCADAGSLHLLPDMNAALALNQIRSIERSIELRKEIAQVYSRALLRTRHRTLIQPGDAENVYFSFPVLLDTGMKEVRQYARKKDIETEPAFAGSIASRFEPGASECPNAESLLLRCLLFPLYPLLGKKNVTQIERVISTLP